MAKSKSQDKKKGLPALEKSPSHLLHRALQLALDIYADEQGEGGVTQRQYAVLAAVEAYEGLTQTDLVRTTGIDRSTLADMVARMIVKGLLERQRSTADARANAVSLTQAGRAALAEAKPKMAAADARLLRLLSSAKREALTAGLRELIRAGDEAAAEPVPLAAKKPKADKAEKPKKAKADKADKAKKKKLKKAA
ncbi:MarR family transcriptional regulator [Phenylobacterium sp. NIBR 498073]|uniref:MarR family winged helix-turn-helix transcriptional regulator n=1 Tax=Phenylobacterium sp. NIBR 498073 TaxID=3015177 RepID=UPI0022B4626F|nr:MarR family transcriptional regulator [Phenylobacterium sp. NIBR 498073]MBS0488507.1 MarR family transcriptional regulator [Pseudomonadota bacterium]WGU40096.1 MarR family transcriptional regulator [Phenylobacterium sp. NIBR 498073]